VTNRWLLHVAATNGQVADVLHDLCIYERPHYNGDRQFEAPSFFRTAKPSRVVWNGEWLWLSSAGSSRPSLRTRLSSW
jgi:hypothetical protein